MDSNCHPSIVDAFEFIVSGINNKENNLFEFTFLFLTDHKELHYMLFGAKEDYHVSQSGGANIKIV